MLVVVSIVLMMAYFLMKNWFHNHLMRYFNRTTNPGIREDRDVHQLGMELMSMYTDMAFLGEVAEDPESIKEALQSRLYKQWQEAADIEFQSLIDNSTWELVALPKGRKPVGCKWVFRTKFRNDGTVEHYKARLVAKGYTQKFGEDYDETFEPVVGIHLFILCWLLQSKKAWLFIGWMWSQHSCMEC